MLNFIKFVINVKKNKAIKLKSEMYNRPFFDTITITVTIKVEFFLTTKITITINFTIN